MTAMVLVYDPTDTAPPAAASRPVPKAVRLQGSVIGFIDNAKPNFNHLVDDLARLLVERHGVASVIKRGKRGPSIPAPDEIFDELARSCDAVVTGSGD